MERKRRRTPNMGYTTEKVINGLRNSVENVDVENSELSNRVEIRFKMEEDYREPESKVVFTELDKFVEMRISLPVRSDKKKAEDVVENLEDFVSSQEEDMPDCIEITLDSDQGEQVFYPCIQITNGDWVRSESQIDTIQNFFNSFFDDFIQEES